MRKQKDWSEYQNESVDGGEKLRAFLRFAPFERQSLNIYERRAVLLQCKNNMHKLSNFEC